MVRALDDADPEDMDDATLAAAWALADSGRQYDGVEEDRRAVGREMAERLGESDDQSIYCYGEEVVVRGVERVDAENHSGESFTAIWVHVDFVNDPDTRTRRVNLSALSTDGGLSALTDRFVERGLVPEWWASNEPVPDSLD